MTGRKGAKRPAGWVNPMKGKPLLAKRVPLETRFWAKVEKRGPDECWEWTARFSSNGYGQIHYAPRPDGRSLLRGAHQVSYELHYGPIPAGLVIDHTCRNRKCVNPAHLRAVTLQVNGTENNISPLARLARRTHCHHCGNPLSGPNLALYTPPSKKKAQRICLTCHPTYWRWAVIPRSAPGRERKPLSKIMQARQESRGRGGDERPDCARCKNDITKCDNARGPSGACAGRFRDVHGRRDGI